MSGTANSARMLLAGVILGGLAFWAGAHWGKRGPLVAIARMDSPVASAPANAPLTAEEQVNVRIYRQAAPAVANVITRTVEYDFFLNAVPVEGAGSGFVIDPKGYILTNYHVVAEAQRIEVLLGEQRTQSRYVAKFIGADQRNDVALIKIDPKDAKLTALPLGDSSTLLVGQKVLAIGNPFGFQSTLTTGVVSALGRTVQTSQTTFIEDAIQTDASINRGNSGGPLLDTRGQVIGINSAIYSPTGTAAGVGFAIPINLAKRIANDLITEGRVRRAVLGVEVTPLFPELADYLKLPVKEGLLIERITPDGPAARAGLRGGNSPVTDGLRRYMTGGDCIVSVDGKPVASQLDLNLVLNRKRPGDSVALEIYRGRQKLQVQVTLGDM
ncbi:MAG TPA: trypsin-like peptidase domain-containing protein [Candidatus Binatia bacterium]|nr:trypsin-like peptidase domain-containing protein [Candidatus Binatia bacterium]